MATTVITENPTAINPAEAPPHQDVVATQPTCILQWHNGILQQSWYVTTYRHGVQVNSVSEWRDVPHVVQP